MSAKAMDLHIEQGATFDFDFTWADTIVATNGATTQTPKNLTGCTARMQVRTSWNRPILLEATTEGGTGKGTIVLGGSAGTVAVAFPASATQLGPTYVTARGVRRVRRRARYDLEIAWPDGRVDRVLQGKVTFDPNVTHEVTE